MKMQAKLTRTLYIGFSAMLCGTSADAQLTTRDSSAAGTVVVTPGAKYRAGWLRRLVLGEDYRPLWTSPIRVDVLDLHRVAGGLRPTQRGGSMQTTSLRFAGGNGREYVFRPSEKDFTRGLPPEVRETLVRDIAQDQVAGYHPAAAVVVASLLDATGLHHPRPRMVVMPNDTLLGEFRKEFAGLLGTFEERPARDFDESPESLGATDVISSDRLFERMRKNAEANRVDTRAFLAARLFDVLVGDRDRHRDQWRWGRFSSAKDALWEPIPRDRDMPFARFEGIGPWAIRGIVPQLVTFSSSYPDMVWLNWNGREIDRRLLVGLEKSVWDSVARSLQEQISDAVVDSAIAQMPTAFVKLNGAELRRAILQRRLHLPDAAREYYALLATQVNFSATDANDRVDVTRSDDGSVRVVMASMIPDSGGAPYLDRRFIPSETGEVRLFLHGGDDRVVVRGASNRRIHIRVIGGDGDDVVADSIPGGDRAIHVYDSSGTNRVESPRNVGIDRKPYRPPTTARAENAIRDWGSWSYTQRAVSYASETGLLATILHTRVGYGFRRDPYSSRSTVRLDHSFGEQRPRLSFDGSFKGSNSENSFGLHALASGIEVIRFHGLGNETSSGRSTGYYRAFQNLFRIEPQWEIALPQRTTVSLGAVGQYTATRDGSQTLVSESAPYGSGTFGELGARADIEVDRRDAPKFPTKGFRLFAAGSVFPALWSVDQTFGQASVSAATYLTAKGPITPTLALRAGAEHRWGNFPFHDAAFLGGLGSLRGWDVQRFAGRSSLYGSAELRLFLTKVSIIVPADFGVMGFTDVGRVYADGDESDHWHTGVGGGIWIAPLTRSNTVSASFARGRERTGFYVTTGFSF
jgi:hypothetical protein